MKNKVLVAIAAVVLLSAGAAVAQNTLAVNGTCALGGTSFGMDITVGAAANNAVYVQSDHPASETHLRLVWRTSLQNAAAPASGAGRNFRFMLVRDETTGRNHKILFLQRQQTTGNWRIAAWSYDETGGAYTFAGGHFFAPYQNAIDVQEECEWTQGGTLTCTRTDNPSFTFTSGTLNDGSNVADTVRFGFLDFDNFNSAGDVCFDEYESYR